MRQCKACRLGCFSQLLSAEAPHHITRQHRLFLSLPFGNRKQHSGRTPKRGKAVTAGDTCFIVASAAAAQLLHQRLSDPATLTKTASCYLMVLVVAVPWGRTPADCSMAARAPLASPWAQKPLTTCRVACLLLKMLITVWCLAISCVISSVSEPTVLSPYRMTLQAVVIPHVSTYAHTPTHSCTHTLEHTHAIWCLAA